MDPADIQRLMERYTSDPEQWSKYALGDASRAYTRNLVDEGNGKSNLVSADPSIHGLDVPDTYTESVSSLSLSGALAMPALSMIMPTLTVS